MKTKYAVERSIISFIVLIGWIGLAIGVIAFLWGLSEGAMIGASLMGAGVATAISSLVLVAVASVAVAILDTGDEARQSKVLLRAIAEYQGVDVEALTAQKPAPVPTGNSETGRTAPTSGGDSDSRDYMGETITKEGGRWYWNGNDFSTLGKAKAAVKAAKARLS